MVSALIVNFYTGQLLPPLLERLLPDPLIGEVLILNNSPEERLDQVGRLEKVRVVEMKKNLGFGRAMNRGAQMTSGDWWLLLNPDTLPDPNCVASLVAAAKAQQVLIAGPRLYWDAAKCWRMFPATGEYHAGIQANRTAHQHALDFQVQRMKYHREFEDFWRQEKPFAQPFLSGACLLIRNDPRWFPEGRIFDERFFLYYEDTDLGARMLLQEQLMLCVPEAEAVHFWDQAPRNEKGTHMETSLSSYMEKYYPTLRTDMPDLTRCGFPRSPVKDWGELHECPVFGMMTLEEPYVLELGINPLMIPKVQRKVIPGEPWLTSQAWARLSPGQYVSQIRTNISPFPIKQWTWRKS